MKKLIPKAKYKPQAVIRRKKIIEQRRILPESVKQALSERRKKHLRKPSKDLLVKEGNTFLKRKESIYYKTPDKRCNARLKKHDSYCRKPAGFGTNHPGEGRCKLHGGCAGRKNRGINVYLKAIELSNKKEMQSYEELIEDKSIEGELAISKLMVKGSLDEYMQRKELSPQVLYGAVFNTIIGNIESFKDEIIFTNKKLKNPKFNKKDLPQNELMKERSEIKLVLSDEHIKTLTSDIIHATKLLKLIIIDTREDLRKTLESVGKLASAHHDMTEGQMLTINIDGIRNILGIQQNVINDVCKDCPKRLEIGRRLEAGLEVKSDEEVNADFKVMDEDE